MNRLISALAMLMICPALGYAGKLEEEMRKLDQHQSWYDWFVSSPKIMMTTWILASVGIYSCQFFGDSHETSTWLVILLGVVFVLMYCVP